MYEQEYHGILKLSIHVMHNCGKLIINKSLKEVFKISTVWTKLSSINVVHSCRKNNYKEKFKTRNKTHLA